MIRLTRRYRFCASHRLHSNSLTDAENDAVYGKCNHPFGHGHDYHLELTVSGKLDTRTGRLIDLERLDEVVRGRVLHHLDHRDLNSELPEFAALVPTTENLALVITARLKKDWNFTAGIESIRLQETKRNRFELKS